MSVYGLNDDGHGHLNTKIPETLMPWYPLVILQLPLPSYTSSWLLRRPANA